MTEELKTFHIKTFGCAMNIADSERCRAILESYGLKQTDKIEQADIIIFNTCSVRQKAEDRIYGLKPLFESLGHQKQKPITVLTGCMAKRRLGKEDVKKNTQTQKTKATREKEIKKQAPWIDIVIEIQEFPQIFERINVLLENEGYATINIKEQQPFLDIQRKSGKNITAGITISHGCDHLCTYCIVPYSRGREENRNAQSIIKETCDAAKAGSKDIILLGQTVNRWINPDYLPDYINPNRIHTRIEKLNKESLPISHKNKEIASDTVPKDFLQLLQILDTIEGNFWLSFMSSHPNYYTKELIDFIAESVENQGHLKPFIHLALQSGNDEILKKMRRDHTIQEFIGKVEYIKSTIPEVSVTTDIIVGFPGETEKQFEDTKRVCEQLKFDQIYISEYSQREGTGASFMEDDIEHETKARRKSELNKILADTAISNNRKLLNKRTSVLVHKKDTNDTYQGRTKHNKLIKIYSTKSLTPDKFYQAKITEATPWALAGIIQT